MSLSKPAVAVYGGTFDPFHLGHQAICDAVLAKVEIDQLRVVPCYLPALKADASASAFQRFEMLTCWRDHQPQMSKIVIDSIEIDRKGPSYTVDTIREIKQQLPQSRILFVLGADAWNSLPKWHEFESLAALVVFWVFAREGETLIQHHKDLTQYPNFEQLLTSSDAGFWLDLSVQLPISSSDIRLNGNLTSRWLPEPVSNYIKKVGLYKNEPVESQEGNE